MSPGPQTPPAHPARGPGLPAGCKGLAFLHRGLCHTPGTVRALAHSMFTPTLCCGDRHCPHFRARVTEAERSGTCSKSHWSMTEPHFKPGTAADSLSRHTAGHRGPEARAPSSSSQLVPDSLEGPLIPTLALPFPPGGAATLLHGAELRGLSGASGHPRGRGARPGGARELFPATASPAQPR